MIGQDNDDDTVPDGGDAHEHQAAKQVDLGVDEDGYDRTSPVSSEDEGSIGIEDVADVDSVIGSTRVF